MGAPAVVRTVSRTVRRRLSSLAALFALASLVLAAALHPGTPQADVDLNDGGVWVTSTSQHLVARLNYPSQQVDGALRTTSATFDVTQFETDVLVPDTAASSVSVVDPRTVSLSAATQLPAGATMAQGSDRVIAVNHQDGTVRATTVGDLGLLSTSTPVLEGMNDAVAVVGTDGSVHAVSATAGVVATVPATSSGWEDPRTSTVSLTPGSDLTVTAVGQDTVVLERGTGMLYLPDGKSVDLEEKGMALQQPGPEADAVLVASRTALISVPLDGSEPTVLEASEDAPVPAGVAAQPVRLGDCLYAAWSGSGQFLRHCEGRTEIHHDETLAASTTPVFRVNREAIVLNDVVEGTVWLPDDLLVLVEDWTDVTFQTDDTAETEDDSAQTSESQSLPDRTEENHPPEAADDSFGVRPGRSTLLPVLANDSDPDGDVLTAIPGDPGSNTTVSTAQGGLALRLDVPADATGTITVPYTADDGRGLSDSAVATIEIRDWSLNEAPAQTSTPTLTIADTGSGTLGVLGNWRDPDGDTIHLVSASGDGLDVRTTNEGIVTVRDLTGALGTREVVVVVSDGHATATGTITVEVQSRDSVVPIANADHVRLVAGTSTVVAPLDNDISPTGEALSLAAIQEAPTGTTVEANLQAGTFAVTAESAQTLYLTYDLAAGPRVTQGVVRIDVVEPSDPSVPPTTEDDTALLREGGSVTIAPLGNDFDPAGGILVLQSAAVSTDSSLTVTVVDHSLLQITAAGAIDDGLEVEYTVSNGTSTATGRVDVTPVTSTEVQVPVAVGDAAVVRAGDVVNIPVLDNDTSPSGLALSLTEDLGLAGDELGTAWVSQDILRFRAGTVAGRTTLAYTVVDSTGQTASAEISIEVRALDEAANVAPSPQGLEAGTVSGSSTVITVPLDGIDSDGDSVALVGLEQAPTKGSVIAGASWLSYTPSEGSTGTDTFTYVVEDRFGATATATVRVGIAPPATTNAAPTAVDDIVVAQPGRTVAVNVVSNDLDADGDTLSLSGTPSTEDDALEVWVRNGLLVAELPQTEGVYPVRYTVTDSRGGTDLGTLTIQVLANAPLVSPVGVDDIVTVDQVDAQGVVTVPVLDNDKDADGNPWDLTLSTTDPGAEVVDQSLRMTVGAEKQFILYSVTDPDGLSGHAVVIVPSLSDLKPRLNTEALPVRIPTDTTTEVGLPAYVLTRAGTTPTVSAGSSVHTGTGIDTAEASEDTLSLTPIEGFTGQTSVSLTVTDSKDPDALESTLTLPIRVESTTNTAPVFIPTEIQVAPGEGALSVDLAAMTTDSDPLKFSTGSPPEGFTTSLAGSTLTVSAAEGAAAGTTGTLEITIDDSVNDPVAASLPLRVTDSTRPLMTTAPLMLTSDGSPVSANLGSAVTNPFPGQSITVSGTPEVTSGAGSVSVSGTTLTITPTRGFTGRLVVVYEVLDATGLASRAVTGTVTVTVATAPDAPSGVTASPAGASSMRVSWAPGSDNGSAVTSYTLMDTRSSRTWTCTASPCLATGLTLGDIYSFQVVATNDVGDSPPSRPSADQELTIVPTAPSSISVSDAGQGSLKLSWQPSHAEGATVSYDVALLLYDSVFSSSTTTSTSTTLSAAPNTYTAQVCAYTTSGGSKNCASVTARAYDPPGTPAAPSVSYDSSGLWVTWDAVAANNSSVSYAVAVTGAVTHSASAGTATSTSVPTSGLGPGEYTVVVTVTASNEAGSVTSEATTYTFRISTAPPKPSVPAAESTTITGQIRVTTPSTVVEGNGWDDDDLTIQYRVVDASGNAATSWSESTVFSGLATGQTYTVQARAAADDDSGAVSETVSSNAVTLHSPRTFRVATSSDDAVCSQQDLDETGFSPGACWRMVYDISGFVPNSEIQCSYEYRDRHDGNLKPYEEQFSVKADGTQHKIFPHRTSNSSQEVTCVQR